MYQLGNLSSDQIGSCLLAPTHYNNYCTISLQYCLMVCGSILPWSQTFLSAPALLWVTKCMAGAYVRQLLSWRSQVIICKP